MGAFTFRMPAGIPGAVTRMEHATIEPQAYDPTAPFSAYGLPAKIGTNGKLQPITTGDVAASMTHLLVRPYPATGSGSNPLGASAPSTSGVANGLRRGYMTVMLAGVAAAAKQAQAYVRIGNPSTGKVIGDIEAAADISVTGTPGANTGNGTIGTMSATNVTPIGTYTATFTAATKYNVTDASGAILGAGTTGAQLTLDNGLSVKITAGGTAFVANDSFSIAVVDNTIAPPGFVFTGPADASGNVEVAFNL